MFPKTLEGSTEGTQTAIQLITCTEYMYSDTLHDNTSQNRGLNTQNSLLQQDGGPPLSTIYLQERPRLQPRIRHPVTGHAPGPCAND